MVWKKRLSKIDQMADEGETPEEAMDRVETETDTTLPHDSNLRDEFVRETARQFMLTVLSARGGSKANKALADEVVAGARALADSLGL